MNIRRMIISEAAQSMRDEEEDWTHEPLPKDPEEARKVIEDEEDWDWRGYKPNRFPNDPVYPDTFRERDFKRAMREAPDDWVDENEDGVWSWGETDKKNRDYSWQKWLEHRKRSAKDSMNPEVHRWNADERRAWEAHRETPRSGNPKNWEYRRGSYYDYRPAYLPKYETRRGWPDAAKIADYWDEVDEWLKRQKKQE